MEPSRLTSDDRDDARQVIALASVAIQRERAAAEQYYVRGRNFVAFMASLFVAVQAGLVATIGRERDGVALLSAKDLDLLRWPAAAAALGLLASLALLVLYLDRPRTGDLIGAGTLDEIWSGDSAAAAGISRLEALVLVAIDEEATWADTNRSRKRAVAWVTSVGALAGLATLVELVLLFLRLT